MREYKGSEIRNIAVVGHGASGKTSLVDALAFVSGSIETELEIVHVFLS